MIKSNSKKAIENIRNYIMGGFDGSNYDIETPDNFKDAAKIIFDIFNSEKPAVGSYARMSEQARFVDWCQGLPSTIDCCYYYNRSAVKDLAAILEESEGESSRYSEQEAEARLTWLIYRELAKANR